MAVRLSLAGFVATAVTCGPGRVGYGLLLPEIRAQFGFSVEVAGAIGSALQVGFVVALSMAVLLVSRLGSRALIFTGGLLAVVGMSVVALSSGVVALCVGVLVTGMSAGFSWSTYNDLAEEMAPESLVGRVLSVVSTGTTLGIAASGVVALITLSAGMSWRAAWLLFVAGAVVSLTLNVLLLGRDSGERRVRDASLTKVEWPPRGGSISLFAVVFVFGIVNAFYWSFNTDVIPRSSAGALLYVVLGLSGFVGLFTGDSIRRFGLGRILRITLLGLCVGAGLLGVAPGSFAVVMVSAVIYGASVMFMSALMSDWSSAIFHERPSEGFTAALLCSAVGNVIGPVTLGAFGGTFGLEAAFLLSAALIFSALFARPAEVE